MSYLLASEPCFGPADYGYGSGAYAPSNAHGLYPEYYGGAYGPSSYYAYAPSSYDYSYAAYGED